MANKFVFVACGSSEHIDTLHFSLRALTYFSKNEIIVVTDSRRNETPIIYNNVIDIETPTGLDHHQASIYLKTALHKILQPGHTYCYLDTDIVALSPAADDIFSHHIAPITFAADHCVMDKFSGSAVNCGCGKKREDEKKEIAALLKIYEYGTEQIPNRSGVTEEEKRFIELLQRKGEALVEKLSVLKEKKLLYAFISIKFNLSRGKFKLDEDTFFDKKQKYWTDAEGNIILKDMRYHKEYAYETQGQIELIEANSPWRWNAELDTWISPSGDDINSELVCNHLQQYISDKFQIVVKDNKWQHWNGGVFLFDDRSNLFLQSWHDKTMQIFLDPQWKTRDQGTLIATCWEYGLENKKLLPPEFNFIADYYRDSMEYRGKRRFYLDVYGKEISPVLIHIYHHWGDEKWAVWQDVAAYIEETLSRSVNRQ